MGNKCDKDGRKVIYEEALKFSEEYNIKLFECSAKNNTNISEIFQYLTDKARIHWIWIPAQHLKHERDSINSMKIATFWQ